MNNFNSQIEQILECTSDGVVIVNREWRFTYLNARAQEMISSGRNMLGLDMWIEFPNARGSSFEREYKATMEDRISTNFIEHYPAPLDKWFEIHAYPALEGIAIFFRDITEKRKKEEALRLCEQAMSAVPVGISIASFDAATDHSLVYVNPAFERMTGYSSEEILGVNCRFLQGKDTEQIGRIEIRAAMSEERSGRVVLRNYTKDGGLFLNDLQMSPMRNSNGEITHYVGIQSDITELQEARDRLARQAQYDALTGLANRYLFMDRLSHGLKGAERYGHKLAVIYMDIDNFKHVNDSLGHPEADYLLMHVARRLSGAVRSADTVARLGGDEFAILATSWHDRAELEKLMDRIIASISSKLHLGGEELMVTASAGVAVYPDDAGNSEDLLRRADLAMYSAKRERKNSWQSFRPSLQGSLQPLNIAGELRRALERKEFELFYQPRIDTLTGTIGGMEALIRWRHPTRGIMLPGQFLRVAEDTGLIVGIGRWAIDEALNQNLIWKTAGLKIVPISVNVSPAQFRDEGFVGDIRAALDRTKIEPRMVELELTESLMMDSGEAADSTMVRLKEMGLRLAIDDFGAGYAGLNYLARFSIDTIKIDRSFTSRILESKTSAAVCRSILHLGQELGLNTVAEGVESKAQALQLRRWQCDEMQGFHFGKPMTAGEIQAFLTNEETQETGEGPPPETP